MSDGLRFEDIPLLSDARRSRRRPTARARANDAMFRMAERGAQLLGRSRLFATSSAVTMFAVHLLPAQLARPAANGFPYQQYYDCDAFSYTGDCGRPCFGFEPHHMEPFYCATCDEEANVPGNYAYWHYVGSRGSIQYKDREGNVCLGKDAWKWTVPGACGNCSEESTYRCHDGYKKYANSATWDPTICEGLVICDGQLSTC